MRRLVRVIAPLLLCAAPAFGAPGDWESAIQAYELQDATSPPPSGQVVVTGSSSIAYWSTMVNDLAPLTIIGRGFGGSTATDLDYFLERIVLKYSPRAVAIYEGDNDIGAGQSPESIAGVMGGILGRISARLPNTRVYIISVKLSPLRISLGQATQVRQLNQLYAALCAGDARYTYVDIMSPLLAADGSPVGTYFGADGLHLNTSGYQVWTAAVRKTLIPQQQIPAPADTAAPTLPGSLSATTVSSSRVDLRWTASSDSGIGLAGYRIWRDGQLLTTTTATVFSDTGLLANTSYTYNVSAFDRAQPLANESARTVPAFATTATVQTASVSSTASATAASGGDGSVANAGDGGGGGGATGWFDLCLLVILLSGAGRPACGAQLRGARFRSPRPSTAAAVVAYSNSRDQ